MSISGYLKFLTFIRDLQVKDPFAVHMSKPLKNKTRIIRIGRRFIIKMLSVLLKTSFIRIGLAYESCYDAGSPIGKIIEWKYLTYYRDQATDPRQHF